MAAACVFLLGLTACANTSTDQQAAVAYEATLSTQIAALQATATTEYERLQVTIQFSETEIARRATQNAVMLSTLQARGVDTSSAPGQGEVAAVPATVVTQAAPNTEIGGIDGAATTDGGFQPGQGLEGGNTGVNPPPANVNAPGAVAVPQNSPTPLPVDPNSPLTNVVAATTVGNDDCAVDPSTQFTSDTQQIYVVARAVDMPAGTTVETQWYRDGSPIWDFSFTYDNYVDNACIWQFADQTEFVFAGGNYRVDLLVNGEPTGQNVQFTIEGGTNPVGGIDG
jgi:hypothetical protein